MAKIVETVPEVVQVVYAFFKKNTEKKDELIAQFVSENFEVLFPYRKELEDFEVNSQMFVYNKDNEAQSDEVIATIAWLKPLVSKVCKEISDFVLPFKVGKLIPQIVKSIFDAAMQSIDDAVVLEFVSTNKHDIRENFETLEKIDFYDWKLYEDRSTVSKHVGEEIVKRMKRAEDFRKKIRVLMATVEVQY